MPPTERKARTGELTPPGMVFWARVKSSSLRVMRLTSCRKVSGRPRRGALMSMASNRSLTTATMSAPAAITCGRVLERDAADGGDRQPEARLVSVISSSERACGLGLGRRSKHAADRHVVGAGGFGRLCALDRRRSRKRRAVRLGPSASRAVSASRRRSSRPRWTPSAPISMASQTSSLTISLASWARQMRSNSAACARLSGIGGILVAVLHQSCAALERRPDQRGQARQQRCRPA